MKNVKVTSSRLNLVFANLTDQERNDLNDALKLFIEWHHPLMDDKSEQKARMETMVVALGDQVEDL